jgi:hypothetical protein
MILVGRFNKIHLQQTNFGPTFTKQHSSSTNTFWAHCYKTAFIFNKHIFGPLVQNSIHLQQTHLGPTITKQHSSSTNTFWAHYYKTAFIFNKHIGGPTIGTHPAERARVRPFHDIKVRGDKFNDLEKI